MDLKEGEQSESSYYFASLFARCDPEDTGLVKVSVLLKTLRELQALAADSGGADDTNYRSLVELQRELDPNNDDPKVNLRRFTEGITSYLEGSSKVRSHEGGGAAGTEQFCESKIDESSIVVMEEEIDVEPVEKQQVKLLRTEISDLKLQLHKVTDDNALLRNHVTSVQDENCSILQALDKKKSELKSQAERLKRLEREMDDKTEIICTLEERNATLSNKFSQLGNELSTFHKERKKLLGENAYLKEEVQKSLQLAWSKEELVSKIKTEAKLAEAEWQNREKCLNKHISTLNDSIDELNQKVDELEHQYSKLKNSKKGNLHTTILSAEELAAAIDGNLQQQNSLLSPSSIISHSVPFTEEHFDHLLLRGFPSTDDIKTELLEAGALQTHLPVLRNDIERFDAATQCDDEYAKQNQVISQCPNCSKLMESLDFKICKEMSQANKLEQPEDDQYLVAQYIPNENLNQEDDGVWIRIFNQILAIALSKSIWCLLVVIILGLAIFTPIDDGCITNPFIFRNIDNYFRFCGQMSHDRVPII